MLSQKPKTQIGAIGQLWLDTARSSKIRTDGLISKIDIIGHFI